MILRLALMLTVIGCGREEPIDAPETVGDRRQSVAIQLNWFPEAEHGGVYQAAAGGIYEASGLDVDIRPGGRATPIAPELQLGRAQFAICNADDVVLFRRTGADIVAVMAVAQNHPRCILVRADSDVETFDDLAGMTLQRQPGRLFLEFLRSRNYLDGVTEVPYGGSVAPMMADPKVCIQAYSFSEPLLAHQAGMETRSLMVSDLGWNPYSSVLVTTGNMVRQNADVVQSVVAATREGWRRYLDDPTVGNAAVLSANRHGMTAEALEFGVDGLRRLAYVDDVDRESIGAMSADRWETLVTQIDELLGDDGEPVAASECFTLQFLR